MRALFARRPRPSAAAPLQLGPDLPIAALREHFAEQRWLTVEGALAEAAEVALSAAVGARSLDCRAPTPQALEAGGPSFMFFEERLRVHAGCRKPCAALCTVGESLTGEALLAFARAVSDEPDLRAGPLHLRAYGKGSHVDHHPATEREIELLCCLTAGWDPAFGGQLRLGARAELVCPRFGALYLAERRPGDAGPLTLVVGHGPLVMLSASLR